MSEVHSGLRLAAPKINGKTIGDLSADDLLAGMSAETKTAMAAALGVAAAPNAPANAAMKPDPEDAADGGDDEDTENEDPADTPAKKPSSKAAAKAFANGLKAGTDRALAVMASEHFAGREAQAAKLLGNPKLSADEIVGMLAEMPDASGAQMLAAMREQKNPDLGTGGGNAGDGTGPKATDIWAGAYASVGALKKG